MHTEQKIIKQIDWLTLFIYLALVLFGWINIYAVSYEQALNPSIFDLSMRSGKQFLWIIIAFLTFFIFLLLDTRFYQSFAYSWYGITMLLLVGTLLGGARIGGHMGWFKIGPMQLQPAEFAKLACSLAVAKYLSSPHVKLTHLSPQLGVGCLILLPVVLILCQRDVGSSLVFSALLLALYREGFSVCFLLIGLALIGLTIVTLCIPRVYMWIGLGLIALGILGRGRKTYKRCLTVILMTVGTVVMTEGVHWVIDHVLKPHQQNRIKSLVNPQMDPAGIGWNVTQSKIAIGSGGLWGKGFLQGTQTKYGFVPEQSTDFIFCTIGEEYGWMGALVVIVLFISLLVRICYLAERQSLRFARVYGYAIASILFFHFTVNLGMTIGLMPVIGIPLPFMSYGGSSLWSFSMMVFILITLDAERNYYRGA